MMKKINLLAVYKNPDGKVSKLLDCLLEVAGRLNRSTTELIAIGDFNLDYLDRKVYNKHKLYLADLLHVKQPSRQLRSSNQRQLIVPRVRTVRYGERSFAFAAPRLWNGLEHHVHDFFYTSSKSPWKPSSSNEPMMYEHPYVQRFEHVSSWKSAI